MSASIVSPASKICSMCKVSKPLSAFRKRSDRPSGLAYHCKECHKQRYSIKSREYHARYHAKHPEKKAQYRAAKQSTIAKSAAAYRSANKAKTKAADLANYEVRCGRLTKQPCEVCGADNADMHHDDYAKPLEVRFLCRSHHQKWHAENGPGLNG